MFQINTLLNPKNTSLRRKTHFSQYTRGEIIIWSISLMFFHILWEKWKTGRGFNYAERAFRLKYLYFITSTTVVCGRRLTFIFSRHVRVKNTLFQTDSREHPSWFRKPSGYIEEHLRWHLHTITTWMVCGAFAKTANQHLVTLLCS